MERHATLETMNVTQPQPCPHYPHLVRHECSRCSAQDARAEARRIAELEVRARRGRAATQRIAELEARARRGAR